MPASNSQLSERTLQFGNLQYRRATGAAPEMECAKSTSRLLAGVYAPGMRVIDVGCGVGHYLRSLRARVDPEIDYLGVDANPHYIQLARTVFPEDGRFECVDGGALPYPDESFDITLCINVIPNIPPPPDKFLQDLLRVTSKVLIVRALFAERNYIIADDWSAEDTLFNDSGRAAVLGNTQFNNMYTETYFRDAIDVACPGTRVSIQVDHEHEPIDNRPDLGDGSTRTENGRQISGPLILDWRYLVMHKP